jgi:molecular chaperone DnaJ
MEEIRKSYRRLAMKFHPDKNPENPSASKQFLKVKEAYDLLSDPAQRKEYDKRHGFTYNRHAPPPTVPQIIADVVALRKYVESLNLDVVDHDALAYHLKKLLTHQRIDLLKHHADQKTLMLIRDEMIKASSPLRYKLLDDAMDPLFELLTEKPDLLIPLTNYKAARKRSIKIQNSIPWLVLLITLLLCYGIFRSTL